MRVSYLPYQGMSLLVARRKLLDNEGRDGMRERGRERERQIEVQLKELLN